MTGDAVSAMAEAVMQHLPAGCKYSAVYQSCSVLLGTEPSSHRAQYRALCWALAADVPALRDGRTVRAGQFPGEEAEIVVQFLASRRKASRPDCSGEGGAGGTGFPVIYKVRVLVGPGAPSDFEVTWSSRYVSYFATRPDGLGFSRRAKAREEHHPYQHHSTLVGMRAVLTVAASPRPAAGGGRPVEVSGSHCPGGLRAFNQALIKMRWRDSFACPFEYEHHCHDCPKGQTSCPAACRPDDLEEKACAVCGRESTHDPAWDLGMCVHCAATGRKRPLL